MDSEVQDRDGRSIPGLYAAGACAWNIAQDTRSYSSGTCLGRVDLFRATRGSARRAEPDGARLSAARATESFAQRKR